MSKNCLNVWQQPICKSLCLFREWSGCEEVLAFIKLVKHSLTLLFYIDLLCSPSAFGRHFLGIRSKLRFVMHLATCIWGALNTSQVISPNIFFHFLICAFSCCLYTHWRAGFRRNGWRTPKHPRRQQLSNKGPLLCQRLQNKSFRHRWTTRRNPRNFRPSRFSDSNQYLMWG